MYRCIELANRGAGHVAPNPMVGAVLVYDDKVIGEGWHQRYGEAHAEVNCIANAVENGYAELVSQSILYVSLEPCAHFGKTPPCTDLIIKNKIPKVVTGCRDPFNEVNGKGIEKLIAAGVETEVGILGDQCKELNKRFFTFHTKKRPYIILKWAETADGKIAAPLNPPEGGTSGNPENSRLHISNEYTNRLVHKWRSEEAAILVGTNTALLDDPELTTRSWPGPSPVRLVVDMELKLPSHLKIFNRHAKTIIFNGIKHDEKTHPLYYKVRREENLIDQILSALYKLNIQSVLVEGGAKLLQSFIDGGVWDEVRRIGNRQLAIGNGVAAPELRNHFTKEIIKYSSDIIEIFKPSVTPTDSLTY